MGLRLSDGSSAAKVGRVTYVAEKINPVNGGFDARAEVSNPDGKLRPRPVRAGDAARRQTHQHAGHTPARGDRQPDGQIVFTVTPDNKLAPRPVELDGWTNGEWIVTKGLRPASACWWTASSRRMTPA